ncbi:hypothetical protein, unlikely [Trypanosoma brucei gambiense DAL972]|uniref:Uncharacterized protein n=1 Tax=Trypanosoma brucei gambiense (strain MHOM/CI/86/DAL972) TaxID=679716 RepID=D0A3K0_TRYB9|nr:hypothetical protein, unlikely [Trypanosoma brucei gambiense DAL972]CBH15844.1 hypothetical protein, unlikely [Trypanosoma brucei gambiense DAL972]|eukprot:XP_011778108.1 hypothetical protein, unlikely [Trypanosoma brucei gambiense DAL972]
MVESNEKCSSVSGFFVQRNRLYYSYNLNPISILISQDPFVASMQSQKVIMKVIRTSIAYLDRRELYIYGRNLPVCLRLCVQVLFGFVLCLYFRCVKILLVANIYL